MRFPAQPEMTDYETPANAYEMQAATTRVYRSGDMGSDTARSRAQSPSTARIERMEEDLQKRLSIGWRNIYRAILKLDTACTGQIQCKQLAQLMHQNGVFVSREELLRLCKRFGQLNLKAAEVTIDELEDFFSSKQNQLDYNLLMKDLNLQGNYLDLIALNHIAGDSRAGFRVWQSGFAP